MFTRWLFKIMIVCFLSAHAMAQTTSPFMTNPNNEDWAKQWKPAYGCHLSWSEAYQGRTCLKQGFPEDYNKGNHAWSAKAPVSEGKTYRFDAMVKYENVKYAMVQVYFLNSDGKSISRVSSANLAGTQADYKPVSFEFTTPAGTESVSIALRLNSPGVIYWDNPQLQDANEQPQVQSPMHKPVATTPVAPVAPITSAAPVAMMAKPTGTALGGPFMTDVDNEDWAKQWKKAYGCQLSSSAAYQGKTCLKQAFPEDYNKGNHAWGAKLKITPGASYRFDCMVKYENIKQAMVQVYFQYPDGKYMSRVTSPVLSGTQAQWVPMSFTFQPPAGSASVGIALRLNSPGVIYWDNPQMHVANEVPQVRFNQDEQHFNLENSVGMVRLFDHQKIKDLNIKWVRYNAIWGAAERNGKGQWDEAYLSKVADNCRKAQDMGMQVMLSLGYPPYWAARKLEGVQNGKHVARSQDDWQDFIRKIVTVTKPYVSCYRIMNEPDHQWDSGAQPVEYTAFLKTGYAAVKSVAPDATVVMAGLSGTPGGYLQAMYDNGAREAMDVAACQPYVNGQKSPEEGHQADRLRAYRMVMAANGDNNPLWITEFGYTSIPVSHLTPMQQAAFAVRSHLITLSCQAGITRMFYYLLRDSDGDGCTRTGGMYDRDWNIKPIGTAVKTLASVINPVNTYLGSVNISDDPNLLTTLFAKADGTHVLAIWHPIEGKQAPIQLTLAEPVTRISWDGQVSAPATQVQFNADAMPTYLVGKLDQLAKLASKPKDIGYEVLQTIAKQTTKSPWIDRQLTEADWVKATDLPMAGKRNADQSVFAHARVIGTSTGLAVKVEIDDDSPASNNVAGLSGVWAQDSVELFLNTAPEQSPAGFVTKQCHQFIASPGDASNPQIKPRLYHASSGGIGVNKHLADVPVSVVIRANRSGYVLSFILPWKVLGKSIQAGDLLGIDLMATCSDQSHKRIDTAAWNGNEGNASDASLWGQIQFIEE